MSPRSRGNVDPMILTFRSATHDDLRCVLSWLPDINAFRLWAGPKVRYSTDVAAVWSDMEASAENSYSLLYKDNRLVGFGQVLLHNKGRGHLARLIVAPELRNQGLGHRLCSRLMNAAERLSVKEFTLNVYKGNAAAVALYRSLGFEAKLRQSRKDVFCMHMTVQQDS